MTVTAATLIRAQRSEQVLEEEGVYGDITFGEYPLDLIPFEEDVLSMELESGFREIAVEGDRSTLYYVARTLHRFQVSAALDVTASVTLASRSIRT